MGNRKITFGKYRADLKWIAVVLFYSPMGRRNG
jgi:hypothetical protein